MGLCSLRKIEATIMNREMGSLELPEQTAGWQELTQLVKSRESWAEFSLVIFTLAQGN